MGTCARDRRPPRLDQALTFGRNTSKPFAVNWSHTSCSQLLRVQRTHHLWPPVAWNMGIVEVSGKASPPSVRRAVGQTNDLPLLVRLGRALPTLPSVPPGGEGGS